MPYYVLDDNNNKIEAYSKEEILSVIAQAVQDGTLANIVADAGFISKIKCCVGGQTYKEAFVTQTKYNELKANNQLIENCLYNIVDDTTADDINEALEKLNTNTNELSASVKALQDKTILNQSSEITKTGVYIVNAIGLTFIIMIDSLTRNATGSHEYYMTDGTTLNYYPIFDSSTKKIRIFNNNTNDYVEATFSILLLKEL